MIRKRKESNKVQPLYKRRKSFPEGRRVGGKIGTKLAWRKRIIVKSLNVLNLSSNSCGGVGTGVIGIGRKGRHDSHTLLLHYLVFMSLSVKNCLGELKIQI